MFECLTSLMVGNPLIEPVRESGSGARRMIQNGIVAAIDIGTFTDVEEYREHIDALVDRLKALPRAEGVEEIFVPGEPENRTYADRIRNGIPLPAGTVRNLRAVAERFDVPLPAGFPQ
jgi:ureidoglycolate dehydrogenase (NAD+)